MTNEVAKKIIRGITDKIECNTVDIDDWAEFWGFTREEYEEFFDMAIKALEQQPCEDCISRQAVIEHICEDKECYKEECKGRTLKRCPDLQWVFDLPSVKPKYTDEEIDKAQAVEQAYVDKMVELAVEEIKERYSDAIGKMRKAIDEMTEIHSDGEFYIKNVDAKWIISKYLCDAKEKPKGRWIATENEEMNIVGYYCSCCDLPMETEEKTKYCPNCGAEMSGGGKE